MPTYPRVLDEAKTVDGSNTYVGFRQSKSSAVFLGHSFTSLGTDSDGDPTDIGWVTWFSALAGQRLTVANRAGVGGNTYAQMLARVATAVTPYTPGWVFLDSPVNDIAAGNSLAQVQADFLAIVAAVAPARVVAYTATPSSLYNTAGKLAVLDGYNAWLRALPAQSTALYPRLIVADVHDAVVDPTGTAFLAALTSDGTHPKPDGALAIAQAIYTAVQPHLPSGLPILSAGTDSLNLLGNAGSFVNPSAGLAAGWTTFGSLGTTTTVARTDNVQGNWQKFVVPAASGGGQIWCAATGAAVGDVLIGSAELEVDALGDGAANFPYYGIALQCIGVTAYTYYLSSADGVTRRSIVPGSRLTLVTKPLTIPAGMTSVRLNLVMYGGGTFRWGRAGVRRA